MSQLYKGIKMTYIYDTDKLLVSISSLIYNKVSKLILFDVQ